MFPKTTVPQKKTKYSELRTKSSILEIVAVPEGTLTSENVYNSFSKKFTIVNE